MFTMRHETGGNRAFFRHPAGSRSSPPQGKKALPTFERAKYSVQTLTKGPSSKLITSGMLKYGTQDWILTRCKAGRTGFQWSATGYRDDSDGRHNAGSRLTMASFGAALADLRGTANRALHQFRTLAPELGPATWPSFLPLTLVKPYLKAMAAPSFDPLHSIVSLNPARKFWRIWRAARRQKI